MKTIHTTLGRVFAVSAVVSLMLTSGVVTAQTSRSPAVTTDQPNGASKLTQQDLETFLDGLVPSQMQREDVAGVVVAVVKDGKLLFAKGYGYADVAKKTPMSPETLVRLGSVSKLFTWTAVMQQVEQGHLQLDRDVNDYLDYKIASTYPQPVTVRDLLTHTGGFEETLSELWVRGSDLKPIGDYLKEHQPHRIFPPGKIPAYSNYGATLAGYLVQRVSGEPYEDYVEKHILQPLGMDHTTFREPLPPALQPYMSTAYRLASGSPERWEFVQVIPAGSGSASAKDMAAFMIAHLHNGKYQGAQILKPETAMEMHARQLENFPALSGAAFGFFEENRNGYRVIGHTGETMYYRSVVHLIPGSDVGLFYSQTSSGKGEVGLRALVWDEFMDRYFPSSQPVPPAIARGVEDSRLVAGSYVSSRRADTSVTKVLTLLSELKVVANGDGTISLTVLKGLNGQPKKLREIAPLLFRSADGRTSMAFRREPNGAITAAIDFPFETFHKASWHENSSVHLRLISASVTLFVVALILWPVTALTRRHFGQKLEVGLKQRRLRMLTRIVCLIDLGFLIAFSGTCVAVAADLSRLSPRFNPWLHLLQLVGWLGILGTAAVALNAAEAWKRRGRIVAIGETLLLLACTNFVWFLLTWRMVQWNLHY